MTTLTLRDAVEVVLDGYTLHPGAREILETAIAQELASQSANTNPVVSQKTAETVDKPVTITCGTCLHKPLPPHASPCDYCTTNFSNWEPKP